jgi:hypothetical protein
VGIDSASREVFPKAKVYQFPHAKHPRFHRLFQSKPEQARMAAKAVRAVVTLWRLGGVFVLYHNRRELAFLLAARLVRKESSWAPMHIDRRQAI